MVIMLNIKMDNRILDYFRIKIKILLPIYIIKDK
jgi:hypothetical protein